MSSTMSLVVWILSAFIFILILYVCYKVSYKLGIKKSLYRTTYIIISIIFAFLLTPLVNKQLFSLDLSEFNITLTYQDKSFTTIIDYIEEVIVHSDFLNDLYKSFPSLKDLFMDFPQVLLASLTYVVLFIVFMILWFPLYLYLSYKRKRRILYDKDTANSHRVLAGALGCAQFVFLVSVLLSPINGISRIYQNSINDTLDSKYSSLCDENESLKEYSKYCRIVETYNSTIFATIGGNGSLSNYIFDSLTRISYDDGYTNLTKEASLIVKSGIVLNQSGLLNSVLEDEELPINFIIENKLKDSDIDIIVDTLSNSKYSEDVLAELEQLSFNAIDRIMNEILLDNKFSIDYSLSKEEAISEIKIILKALTVLSDNTLLEDIIKVKDIVIHFINEVPENRKNEETVFAFILDIINNVNLEDLELFCEYLFESKLFNKVVPYFFDLAFSKFGFSFVATGADVLDQFYNVIDFAKLFRKYQPINFFDLMGDLDDEELMLVGEIMNYMVYADDSEEFIKFLLGVIFKEFDYYSPSTIMSIKDWTNEVHVLQQLCVLVETSRMTGDISIKDVASLLTNKDSEFVKIMLNTFQHNTNYLVKQFIKSLSKKVMA